MHRLESDDAIDQALRAHERDLLRSLGDDPGHLSQVAAMFGGHSGWVSMVLIAAQAVLFLGGVWAGWQFLQASDPLVALRWGLPGAVMLIMSLMIKLAMWPTMHANRLALQLKRIEVRLAQVQGPPLG